MDPGGSWLRSIGGVKHLWRATGEMVETLPVRGEGGPAKVRASEKRIEVVLPSPLEADSDDDGAGTSARLATDMRLGSASDIILVALELSDVHSVTSPDPARLVLHTRQGAAVGIEMGSKWSCKDLVGFLDPLVTPLTQTLEAARRVGSTPLNRRIPELLAAALQTR
eukprot:Sspe_Gene.110828::Locus_91929_Transcript_1_1_Confidence_1.000_Length_822::g.110828::m.110828